MKALPPSLPNKPLIEALIEVHWALPGESIQLGTAPDGDPAYPLVIGPLFAAMRDQFPYQRKLPSADIPDQFTPHQAKYQFRATPDGWPLFQVGPGLLTLNHTTEYSWNAFREDSLRLWAGLAEAQESVSKSSLTWTRFVMRYINLTPLGGATPLEFLRSQLHIGIQMPSRIVEDSKDGAADALVFTVRYPLMDPGCSGTFQAAMGLLEDGSAAMRWELLIETVPPFGEQSVSDFSAWLDRSHSQIEAWFCTLIEGDLFAKFSGEG